MPTLCARAPSATSSQTEARVGIHSGRSSLFRVTATLPIIGPGQDIPAPDVYRIHQILAWIMDTHSMTRGYLAPGAVTGKPLEMG